MRIGFGYDVHRYEKGESLILGGVDIDYELGLKGHSDADVLVHAVMDALLGALVLGDIGKHFPDTDEKYRGIDSLKLLSHVYSLVREKGYALSNLDSVLVMQAPKVAPYIETMRENIAKVMGVDKDRVSVKATTEEKLGFSGRKEGVKAYSVCLLEEVKK